MASDTASILDSLLDSAVEAAPLLEQQTPSERAELLDAIASALDAGSDELIALAIEETALGRDRLKGEVARTTKQLRLFARVVEEGSYLEVVIDESDTESTPPTPDLRRMLVPLGPVAVFAAGNFPFAFSVAGGDTAAGLAAGCPVIVKAHPGHPNVSRLTADLVREAVASVGAPRGTFGLIEGFEAGAPLVEHPSISAVAFTGSLNGGRALFDLATSRVDPIPFYGELGSINPVILTPTAVQERSSELATGLVESATLGVGQFCTKPGVVFVPQGTDFESALAVELGDGTPQPMLNTDISHGFAKSLDTLTASGDLEVIVGNPAMAVDGREASPVVLGTGVQDLVASSDRLLAECFGPAVLLVRYETEEELHRALRYLPGSLTITVHTSGAEDPLGSSLFGTLHRHAGRVIHNGWPTGVAVSHAQHHGGPWPATTDPLHTSVGSSAIRRFLRPVAYQDMPSVGLPAPLRDSNPLGIPQRRV